MKPEIPVALVLFKDKGVFDGTLGPKFGQMNLIKDQIYDNDKAKTPSTFSSDGVTYDLELKPDITTPGDNIRGAIPPQKKEDREAREHSTYAFLSGTSMAAPNYAGAQSVVLSKQAKSVFGGESAPTTEQLNAYLAYRNTVDMRLLSTAEPMEDLEVSPESGVKTFTSPRVQGAGLVNLGAAYKTDVYLEGKDLQGNTTGEAKVQLKNSEAINNGRIELNFVAHNESDENRIYNAYLTVMRPAIKNDNSVVTKDYNYRGEIDDITLWPGRTYWVEDPEDLGNYIPRVVSGDVEDKDVFKVSREFDYVSEATYNESTHEWELTTTTVPVGKYVYTAATDSWGVQAFLQLWAWL